MPLIFLFKIINGTNETFLEVFKEIIEKRSYVLRKYECKKRQKRFLKDQWLINFQQTIVFWWIYYSFVLDFKMRLTL